MARKPSNEEITSALVETQTAIEGKIAEFEAKGKKPFRIDSRIGVLPQEVYDQHRSAEDPDYKPREEA